MGPTLSRRLKKLCHPEQFTEIYSHEGSVYTTGTAEIGMRKVVIIATNPDLTTKPPDLVGSLSRFVKALKFADSKRLPVVFLHDVPAQYQSGRTAFQGSQVELLMGKINIGSLYYEISRLFNRVPLVAGVFGHMAQAQAFPPAMCHGLVMLKEASLSVARPDAVEAMLGEINDYQSLGGALLHHRQSGTCDEIVDTEIEALEWIVNFLSYLSAASSQSKYHTGPMFPDRHSPKLEDLIPKQLNQPFDAHKVICSIVDQDRFLEMGRGRAAEIVTGLARVDGCVTGILANNPRIRGAVLFPETCRKMVRFIKICDALGLPLVFLADSPGFMIGRTVEKAGIVSAGADLFAAIAQSTVPRLCIVLRRAYTAGLYAMSGSGFGATALYALTGASISVYGPEAINRFLKNLNLPPEQKEEIRHKMEEESCLESMVDKGFLTGIIKPQDVRMVIADFLKSG